jgi:hypothetical protein
MSMNFLSAFLVLPGVAQGGKARLQGDHLVLEVAVEPLEFLGKTPHLLRIHDCLGHKRSFSSPPTQIGAFQPNGIALPTLL